MGEISVFIPVNTPPYSTPFFAKFTHFIVAFGLFFLPRTQVLP